MHTYIDVHRLCCVDDRFVGLCIDAVDKNKFGIPTADNPAKCLKGIHRVKQKLTGVQFFGTEKLLLYQTLPDVPTGGNLTLTILADLFKRGYFDKATDIVINFDGASDNICYKVLFGLALLLHVAKKNGWPLRRIHILRFKVGLGLITVRVRVRVGLPSKSLTHPIGGAYAQPARRYLRQYVDYYLWEKGGRQYRSGFTFILCFRRGSFS